MKASEVIMHTNRILIARTQRTENDLTASELRDILSDFDLLLGNAVAVAPCDHKGGSRWYSRQGERCGICSRTVKE